MQSEEQLKRKAKDMVTFQSNRKTNEMDLYDVNDVFTRSLQEARRTRGESLDESFEKLEWVVDWDEQYSTYFRMIGLGLGVLALSISSFYLIAWLGRRFGQKGLIE